MTTLLICDDEELIRWSLGEHLRREGFHVVEAESGEEALARVADSAPDLAILDLKLPGISGLEALRRLREQDLDLPVIVITAHGAVDSAIDATRLGASDYLAKPFDLREVTLCVRRALESHRLRTEVHYLREHTQKQHPGYGPLVGRSASMRAVYSVLARLERIDTPTVLITGESGTGKDVVARAIHAQGMRKSAPFMEVDCASLPETLIESELFGHERGAFTGALAVKRGLFEVAKGGILFLDEIGEMHSGMQARLLRALENRRFKRVGGVADIPLDAGVVAATNRDLPQEVKQGRFREDLFFRLNVVPIHIPPLRERREDIPLLAVSFIERFNKEFGRKVSGISAEAEALMQLHAWPGNVRELKNVIERVMILESDDVIRAAHLPPEIRALAGSLAQADPSLPEGAPSSLTGPSLPSIPLPEGCPFQLPEEGVDLERSERGLVIQAMNRTAGNQAAAARLLGISRYALRNRLEKFGIVSGKGEEG